MSEEVLKKQRPKGRQVLAKPELESVVDPGAVEAVPDEDPGPAVAATPGVGDTANEMEEPSAHAAVSTEAAMSSGAETEGAQATYAYRLRFHRRKRRR
jgi:hypothetical protein